MQLNLPQKIRLRFKILCIYANKIFSARSMERIIRDIILGSDTTTIRIILANASLVWAVMLITHPKILDQSIFDIMNRVGGSTFWIIAYLIHFFGVYWKACDLVPTNRMCIIINAYGFLLWFFTTVSTNYYLDTMDPGTALGIVICGAAAWALYKTGSTVHPQKTL